MDWKETIEVVLGEWWALLIRGWVGVDLLNGVRRCEGPH